MKPDNYTRFLLTVIAGALVILALRPAIPEAHAADTLRCTVEGPMQIKGIDGTLQVQVEPKYGAPGSSSSNRLYIQTD